MSLYFGKKLKKLRKGHDWSQAHLAAMIGIHGHHIGKYELGKALPNAEAVIKLAKALDVSIDYLLMDDWKDRPEVTLHDKKLLDQFHAVEDMKEEDRSVIFSLIDAYIKKQKIELVIKT